MKPADRAWCVLATGVVAYDLCARDGETLSDGAGRYPRLPRSLVVAVLALHLLKVVPDRYDPLHWLFVTVKRRGRLDVRQLPEVGT